MSFDQKLFDTPTIAIRRVADDERSALTRLCALDSAPLVAGEALVAYVDGEPWAAISLDDGRVVADPFRPSGQAAELLRVRRAHMRAERPGRSWLARALLPRRAAS